MRSILVLMLLLLAGIQISGSVYAGSWISQFYGEGCKARWSKCVDWVKNTCGGNVGGCNGSCVFGISGDCEADDFQIAQNQNESRSVGSGRNQLTTQNQRLKSKSNLKYSDMMRDPSAVRNGSYQVLQRGGMVLNKNLTEIEAKQIGLSTIPKDTGKPDRPGIPQPQRLDQ